MSTQLEHPDYIRQEVRAFILKEFLDGENPASFSDTTSLIRGGILDSISSMRLVEYLERTFKITLTQDDVRVDNFDTVTSILRVLATKLKP